MQSEFYIFYCLCSILVLSAEDHAMASEMDYHYTTHDYRDTRDMYIGPGDEGFDLSHGGGEYADFEDFHCGFGDLTWYVMHSSAQNYVNHNLQLPC